MNRVLLGVRSVAFLLCFSSTVVLYSLPLSLAGWLLPEDLLNRVGKSWAIINLWLLRTLCGLDYRVQGLEHLPQRASVVLSKHQSAWETIALRAILPLAQTWVLKRELLWIPFFGWGLAPYQPIAIDRGSGRKAARKLLERGTLALQRGRWLVVFPEGTRVAPGERSRYGIGGAMLSAQTQVPIVPVAHNAGVYWPRRSVLKYPGVIQVIIGEPIVPDGKSPQEINREVQRWIESTVSAMPLER